MVHWYCINPWQWVTSFRTINMKIKYSEWFISSYIHFHVNVSAPGLFYHSHNNKAVSSWLLKTWCKMFLTKTLLLSPDYSFLVRISAVWSLFFTLVVLYSSWAYHYSFMVSNDLVILLRGRIKDSFFGKYRFIISFNVIRAITRDSHHPELVPDPSRILTTFIHSRKLISKAAAIHIGLFIG